MTWLVKGNHDVLEGACFGCCVGLCDGEGFWG